MNQRKVTMTTTDDSLNPQISICLPTLNAGRYLESRLDSIANQTFSNWELVVIDGFSDDGSWEMVKKRFGSDPRANLNQQPRQGIYKGINEAIRLARGEYVYIATADDTMEPNCLEVLLHLAKRGGGRCIAQCGLTLIDEDDLPLGEQFQWPANTEWASSLGQLFQKSHCRRSPFDGATVLLFGTLITSLTQALFPRDMFSSLGGFPADFGSAGDMAWEGLAGFFYDVHYTPERLATWRIHEAQATQDSAARRTWPARRIAICDWIFDQVTKRDPQLGGLIKRERLTDFSRFWQRSLSDSRSDAGCWLRGRTALLQATDCPKFYSQYLFRRFVSRRDDPVTAARRDIFERFLNAADRRQRHD